MIYTFGSEKPREMLCPYATITIVSKRNVERMIRVNIVPYITTKVPMAMIESPMIDILADDTSTGEGIDLLIGNDLYFSFIRKSVDLGNNTFLVDSDFGWFLAGSATNNTEGDILSVATYCQCHDINQDHFTEPDLPLRTIDVKFLWSLESIGICDSPKTTCEEEAVQHFNKTVKYSEGRYQVKWPWIEYPPKLPTNFGLAFGRLKGVLRRSNKEDKTEYEKILKEQLEANIIEIVDPSTQVDHPVHYLPFHMVQQKGKRGRLVYDASAKLKNEKSLNECLYRGPNMLEDLTGLLLKFRIGKIAVTADVEKAFLQVGLQKEDRDVTRFLWVKDLDKELAEDNIVQYRFCRVTFGVISSPFLLAATIRYHISRTNKSLLPVIADKCYVDNLVTSVQSREEALKLYAQTRNSFNELGMNIRDWMSNDKEFMDKIPKQERAKPESEMKILGLVWNLENDTLRLNLNNDTFESETVDRGITKKGVLRMLARLYDPCGFVSPLVLPGKLLFQEICTRKFKWDEILPEDLLTSWRNIIKDLKAVNEVELPRHVTSGVKPGCTKYELHCFTDASMNAYAAVVYLRVITEEHVSTSFLMSKCRITPAEDKSDLKIPRLELLGCLIGSRLLKYVKSHLDLNICKIYLWTDSQCEKYAGGPYKLSPPPALPSERVNYSSPFTFTGLDYLGPVLVETNTGREKRWICLMTCLAVRAVHLELVKALTAEECLLAIRRFVAARGPPKVLISDNALQFKLTSEVLIKSYCQEKHIKWKFITQLAPWQGGFYERLVGLVKHCLKRTLDKHLLTDGQMQTVVKEIEAVLNTRPLTAVGSDPEAVLRPADFLSLGECLEINSELCEGTSQGTNTKVDLVEGWKRGQRILNEYKEMFTNQYLPSLRDRFSHSHK
ncbi:uncharacterized protein LOC125235603 [Leguminivora glycinivorella]|uniref:uncharacterized protein LOC125235603 n=1 Tax=Leguminivora glycinivorella TaxID=1035111 RepID=UPI002010083F|nr:uncharacterized protein LOC125235603 [Leguminivora glycinivorella]